MAPTALTALPRAFRRSIDNVLWQLNGHKKLDVFECARRDPKVPMEVTFRTMQEYIDKGLLGGISLSEVDPRGRQACQDRGRRGRAEHLLPRSS
ncbi:hypothetical protein L209DRAFT_758034 [Thermothelomyces heterothallicus CBS 203.75]